MKRIAALCLTVALLVALFAIPASAASGIIAEVQTYGTQNYDEINEVLTLVNTERAAAGLDPLVMDPKLVGYAMQRAAECAVLYSHTRPDDSSCFSIMDDWGSAYIGENIAAGYSNAGAVMNGWMNSEGHKANILSSDYTSIGIGCFYQDDGTRYWVQLFSSTPASGSYSRSGATVVENISINVDYNMFFLAMDELNDDSELELYEGTTSPVTFYLLNGGWEYASPLRLTGGYTLRSSNTACMTVDPKSDTITGIASGTSNLVVDFSGTIVYNVPTTVWPTPSISCNTDSGGNNIVTWDDPSNNVYLFGKEAEGGDWSLLATPEDGNEYINASAGSEEVWNYKLSAWLPGVGWQDLTDPIVVWPVQAPAITQLNVGNGGIVVNWDPVQGAGKYRVYVKTTGEWTKVADTVDTSLTYTDVQVGTTYTFSVRCLNSDGTKFTSDFDKTGASFTYTNLSTPAITQVANTANGVKVTWGAVSGAAKYRLYVKTAGGKWTKVGDTTGTSLTYTKAVSGTTYTFTVRCLNAAGNGLTSDYNPTGKSITYFAPPAVSSLENTANGVTVTWYAVNGAAKYRLYVKAADGKWTIVGDTEGTSLTYTNAVSGTNYSFTVRCLSNDGKTLTSSYDPTGKSITYIAQPAISRVANSANGVTVTWGAVSGAAKYRVYVKTAGGKWTKVGDTTGTSLTYTKAVSGTNYTFTVRCLNADATAFTSSFDPTGKSITYIGQPAISSVSGTANGVNISWSAVKGAAKYRVYIKTSTGWTRIGDTTGTNLTYTKAVSGKTYTFTVRCVTADGKSTTSSYDATGKSITYNAQPVLTGVANTANGVKISWGAVSGAAKYRVYIKTSTGWTRIGDTTGTSLTYTKAVSGTSYTFTVRCISADGKSTTSSYDTKGKSITYIAQPAISAVENTASGVNISWGAVSGAAKYRVFVKTSTGWAKIGDTTGTSLTYTKAVSGKTYTFTVRCLNADATAYTSSYDAAGKSITYIAQPAISAVKNTANGVTVTWGAVNGAAKYRLYVKTAGGKWTKVGDTTGNSLTYTKAVSGTTYTFTVRCLNADATAFTSSFDPKGRSITYSK